jgi:hypothetical protein
MAIPEGAIFSEDGQFVIGVHERKDRYGVILPESEWMYKRPVPAKNMMALIGGVESAEIRRKKKETREETRVTKFDAFLRGLERGLTRSKAASSARLPYSTVRTRIKGDPLFEEAVKDAEMVAVEAVREVVWEEIIVNKNAEMGMKWLQKRDPDFADRRETVNTVVSRLELPGADRLDGVRKLLESLNERKALTEGRIIDLESEEG